MRLLIAGVIVAALAVAARADPSATYRLAMNNLGHETIECAAYFSVVAAMLSTQPLPRAGDDLIADQMTRAGFAMFKRALAIAEKINQKQEAVEARFQMHITQMSEEIGGDAINISILLHRYGRPCQVAADDMAARVEYWVDQAINAARQAGRQK